MPRLTAELIAEAPQFTNPVKDWELDLRGELSSSIKRHRISDLRAIFLEHRIALSSSRRTESGGICEPFLACHP